MSRSVNPLVKHLTTYAIFHTEIKLIQFLSLSNSFSLHIFKDVVAYLHEQKRTLGRLFSLMFSVPQIDFLKTHLEAISLSSSLSVNGPLLCSYYKEQSSFSFYAGQRNDDHILVDWRNDIN